MKFLLIDLQYFPSVEYYLTLCSYKHVIFELYDHHRKMSFRNRCIIAGANGHINLSVPLIGGRDQKTIAREVKIDNSVGWQKQHFKSLVSAYNRSPFFEYYQDDLDRLFQLKCGILFEWNLACMEW